MEDREKGFDRKKRGRTSSIRYGENDSMDTDKKQSKRGSFWQSARDMEDENSPRLGRGLERLVFCRSKEGGGGGKGRKERKRRFS